MVMQGSRNFFQWRVKRASKAGNCTIRVSADGESFQPITPVGKARFKFACGRASGYESAEFVLPKPIIAEKGGIIQLEFETDWGTTVQCADIIIQKSHPFVAQACDPKCKNGGVCSNGVCKCSKMYTGDSCETKGKFIDYFL